MKDKEIDVNSCYEMSECKCNWLMPCLSKCIIGLHDISEVLVYK